MKPSNIGNIYIVYCAASPLLSLLQNMRIFQLTSFVFSLIAFICILGAPKQKNRLIIIAVLTLSFLSGLIHSISWSGFLFDFICSGLLVLPFLKCKQLILFAKPIFALGIVVAIPFLFDKVLLGENLSNNQRLLRLGEFNYGDWYSIYIAISSFVRLFSISMLLALLPHSTSDNPVNNHYTMPNKLQAAFEAMSKLLQSTIVWWLIHISAFILAISLGLSLLKVQFAYETLLAMFLYLIFSFRFRFPVIIGMIGILLALFIFAFSLPGESILLFKEKVLYGSEQSRIQESMTFWDSSSFLDFLLGHGFGGSFDLYPFGGALHVGLSNLVAKLGVIGAGAIYYITIKQLIRVPKILRGFYSASFLFLVITSFAAPNYGIYPLASVLFPCLLFAPKSVDEIC